MRIQIPGRVYVVCVAGSSVPAEENWPTPRHARRGYGTTHIYEVDEKMGELILSHIQDMYECASDWTDADAVSDKAAMRTVLRRYGKLLPR
jgi:hypothetical protein